MYFSFSDGPDEQARTLKPPHVGLLDVGHAKVRLVSPPQQVMVVGLMAEPGSSVPVIALAELLAGPSQEFGQLADQHRIADQVLAEADFRGANLTNARWP